MILGLGLLNQAHRRAGIELFEARVGARLVAQPRPWRWRVYTRGARPPEWQGLSGFEEVVCPPVARLRGARFLSEQVSWAWELARRPVDLLLCLAFCPPMLQGSPFLMTVHDLNPFERPQDLPSHVGSYWRTVLGSVVPRARRITTPSDWVRARCASLLSVPEDRIDVVYSGVEPRYFRAEAVAADPILRRLGVDGPFWLHCGTVQPRKNLEVVVHALALLRARHQRTPHLIGVGRVGPHGDRLRSLARDLGVADRVTLAGSLADDDLAALYRACAAFVYPSWIEGFGVPPLEALASGAAVIASRTSCLPEILGDSPRWADPSEPETWLDAWAELQAESPSVRDDRVRAGRERAGRYTWDDTAARWGASLERALLEEA